MAGATYPEWIRPSRIPLAVVCGPPGSGKSTWAQGQVGKNGLVIDLDEIGARLSGLPRHVWGQQWLNDALRQRNSLIGQLSAARPRWPRAALIVSEPTAKRREWWAGKLKPRSVVVLETPADVCVARIQADAERAPRCREDCAVVATWWQRYQRRHEDVVIRPQ